MDDDGEPSAAEVLGWQCVKEYPGETGRSKPSPGHAYMDQNPDNSVCQPVPLAEHAVHFRQQYSPEKKLFAKYVKEG